MGTQKNNPLKNFSKNTGKKKRKDYFIPNEPYRNRTLYHGTTKRPADVPVTFFLMLKSDDANGIKPNSLAAVSSKSDTIFSMGKVIPI